MRRIFALLILVLLAAVALPAYAHVNGVSYEKTKDGYQIDAGYGAPAPAVGESLLMDFRLRQEGKDVPFTDTWVKITAENGAVVFASGIHNSEFGGPRISYVFPREGKYEVSMRFENNDQTLVEDSFPITVLPASGTGIVLFGMDSTPYLLIIVGIALGVIGALLPGVIRSVRSRKISNG